MATRSAGARWLAGAMLLLNWTAAAFGCLWDRDTLAAEARGHLDVVRTAVGDFERFPARYYELRAERVAREIEAPDASVALFDDLAVALDKLGRQTEAIAWMERKAAVVEKISDPKVRAEQEYRRRANLGTFYAHRWIRSADLRAAEPDLREGIRWIGAALELNPNAHFGRERYQLQALEWYLEGLRPVVVDRRDPKFPSVDEVPPFVLAESSVAAEAALAGLSGIVQLGGAWENVDIFAALAHAARSAHHASLALLLDLRRQEIAGAGGKTANLRVLELEKPEYRGMQRIIDGRGLRGGSPLDRHAQATRQFFAQARRIADANHAARLAFLQRQFELGRHPDTHPDFWQGAPKSLPLPELPDRTWLEWLAWILAEGGGFAVGGAVMLASAVFLSVRRRLRRRRGGPAMLTPWEKRFALYSTAAAVILMILTGGAFFLG